jgi:ribosomal protein L37AE/L43A
MVDISSKILAGSKPPACPTCHTAANVHLDREAAKDAPQMWRCDACQVWWEVKLTPRSER